MDNKKDDLYYLNKIINDVGFIILHTKDKNDEEIKEDEVLIDSILFRFIQIAENTDRLTDEFKAKYSFIPWRYIKGMRNKIVHEYGDVDLSIIISTVKRDLPEFLEQIKSI